MRTIVLQSIASAATADTTASAKTKTSPPALPGPAAHHHLGRAIEAVARACPSRIALVASQRSVTYDEVLQSSTTVRNALWSDAGFRPGDRVMLWLPNGPEYLAAFYGTLRAGGVVVPTPPDVEPGRFAAIRSMSESRIVLTSEPVFRRRADRTTGKPETLPLDARIPDVGARQEEIPAGDAPAAIFFTSGSTGEPKGVTLSHKNLLANAQSIIEYLQIASDDRALGLLPFYHAFGNSVLQTHLLRGATIVLGGSLLFPETILDTIRQAGVTSLSGVPDVFRTLLSRSSLGDTSLPTLQTIAIAGGRLDPDQTQVLAFRAAPAKVFVMYGQTEATARLSYLPPEFLEERYGSIGRGIPGVELQVLDDDGRSVAPGETGEICASGPNVMLGYWRDPESTSATIRDGWLRTGDLATVDDDGFIYPQGRRSGLVKIAGFRVHPSELEEFIRREADVLEVVAIPFETTETGTRLALFVQPWREDGVVTAETLRGLCVASLPRHLVPEHIEVLTRFPLNDAYKVDRRALRRRAEKPSTPVEELRT